MRSTHQMKLGIFGLNISGGLTLSTAAKAHLDWDDNVAVATMADRAGWDFLLPLGRWRGWGGKLNSNSEQYETFTWASALAAHTQDIFVFSTCHVPIFHPMLAAKLAATIDNTSNGRFGINIVAGWNEAEFGMFGLDQLDHDARYAAANEWLERDGGVVVRRCRVRPRRRLLHDQERLPAAQADPTSRDR